MTPADGRVLVILWCTVSTLRWVRNMRATLASRSILTDREFRMTGSADDQVQISVSVPPDGMVPRRRATRSSVAAGKLRAEHAEPHAETELVVTIRMTRKPSGWA